MKTDRFETFADAILAIVMTVLILKIPQPVEPTVTAIWNLRTMYIAYAVSFLIIYNTWYNNHNLFQLVDEIDNRVIAVHGVLLFIISVLPYFTIWLANHVNSLPAETMFGLIFVSSNILSNISVKTVFRSDPYNKKLIALDQSNNWMNIPLVIQILGFVISYTVYVPAIYISCFVSIILWILLSRRNRVRCDEA